MAKVILTANLKQYFPDPELNVEGVTVLEILNEMEQKKPNFKSYILDEHNCIRKHVNIFINGKMIKDKSQTDTAVDSQSEIHIMQALSGG